MSVLKYVSVFAGVIDESKLDVDFLYFFIIRDYQSYFIEENNTNDKKILELVHRKLSGVPLLEICRVVNSINRLFVFVDYANKLSPT